MAKAPVLILVMFLILIMCQGIASARGTLGYGEGIAKIREYIRINNFAAAETVVKKMLTTYHGNPELLAILARLSFWQQKYEASLALYDRLLRHDATVALVNEREKVVVALELHTIDLMQQSNNMEAPLVHLEKLYHSQSAPYEAGYRLASVYLQTGAIDKALALTKELAIAFPGDLGLAIMRIAALMRHGGEEEKTAAQALLSEGLAHNPKHHELLTLQAQLYFRGGQYDQALAIYDRILNLGPDAGIKAEREKVALARALDASETMARNGDLTGAEAMLEQLFRSGKGVYDTGCRLAGLQMRRGAYSSALPVLAALREEYPNDSGIDARYCEAFILDAGISNAAAKVEALLALHPDDPGLLRLSGLLHLWDHDFSGATADFQKSCRLHPDDQVRRELETALILERLKGSEALRLELVAIQSTPDQLRLQARYNFWKGRIDESLGLYAKLLTRRASEEDRQEMERTGLAAAYADAAPLPVPPGQPEDPGVKADKGYLKVTGEYTGYNRGIQSGKDFTLEVSRQLRALTLVPTLSNSSRFGKNNSQIGVDIYSRPGEGEKSWGSVSLSVSPDADFLPLWTAGVALYTNLAGVEASAAYRRMEFRDSAVDLFTPGVAIYLPAGFRFDTKLYLAHNKGAFSLSAAPTLTYEPGGRFKAFYSVVAGRSAERISQGNSEIVEHFTAIGQKAGCEYRYMPAVSLGADISNTYRQGFYSTTGVAVFTRIWW